MERAQCQVILCVLSENSRVLTNKVKELKLPPGYKKIFRDNLTDTVSKLNTILEQLKD
jgi:hypothetical protein